MTLLQKISAKQNDLTNNAPVTVAFLGDSVTQGCFECYLTSETSLQTVFDYKSAYSTRFKEILNLLYPNVQINIIDSGISGDSAAGGLARIDRDVIAYRPDLCIVSYGLNDACCCCSAKEYKKSLDGIFKKLKENGIETIFLTQNAMCTKTSCHLRDKFFVEVSQNFAKVQNDGKMSQTMQAAREACLENGVKICDLYPLWEKMLENGVDTTELLANKLNHPLREYHYYIAIKLIELLFGF